MPRKPEANEDWPARRRSVAALFSTRNAELVGKHVESINIVKMSGVDVHVVTPKAYDNRNDPTALLYIHGGGYVGGSSDSTYLVCVPIATRLGLRVYSIDYRLAPSTLIPRP